ncbi:hypothetical protein CDL15_Pgr027121 [Punica granatum]|uniref:Extensin-like n=1 Tax=Punica granatum TaxID=22663 RepID=A0A218Y1E8_PUNGR|nr:hypothetical protein CDL15_Pgr027121 [Punica granatum]
MPAQSIPKDTRVISSPASTAYSGIVNQLAANMNTNMTELMAMLRDQNRASSSHTPSPERRTTVHRNPIDPPIYVTDSEDMSFPAMTYVPTISPVSDPMPPPSAPTSVPFPPAVFLSTEPAMITLPPLTMPTQSPI